MSDIRHLNCGTLCPLSPRLVEGSGSVLGRARRICRCLLIEGSDGLILVDTGLGTADLRSAYLRLGLPFMLTAAPSRRPGESALAQVKALGYGAADVRHIVLTHLDMDHAGGLADFPHAEVHVHAPELEAVQHPRGLKERLRYARCQFAHGPRWQVHPAAGERWLGFEAVRPLRAAGRDILLVPLPGHTRGHCGVAVSDGAGWLLHVGDCVLDCSELHGARYCCPPALRVAQWLIEHDGRLRARNRERLRALLRENAGVQFVCSHDPHGAVAL